jgi:hypothetical protein
VSSVAPVETNGLLNIARGTSTPTVLSYDKQDVIRYETVGIAMRVVDPLIEMVWYRAEYNA